MGEEQKQKEEAFFVTLNFKTCPREIDRDRWNNDDRLFLLIERLNQLPERNEFLLELIEPRRRFFGMFDSIAAMRP